MKKVSILLVMATFVLAGTSCKKNRTCTCTGPNGYSESTTVTASKKDAEAFCDNAQTAYGSGYSCSLD